MGQQGRIRDDDIAEVRDRATIEDVVSQHTTLRRSGADSLKGLCPFHDERTPSFHVTPSKGMFYCHGCQEGGDAIYFVQQIEHIAFPEAVRMVAAQAGVHLHEDTPGSGERRRGRHYEILAAAAEFFRARLNSPEAAAARRLLADRGFAREDAERAGCGYAPADGNALLATLRDGGYRDEEVIQAGLARRGESGLFAFFRDRLLWPITSTTGRVVGFGARRLSEGDPFDGKYVNSPESDVFHKSDVLFGLDQARKAAHRSGRVVVVEGYTDVMACRAAGVDEVVATCGTAFGAGHRRLLTRTIAPDTKIVFCFDADAGGKTAARRAWTVCADDLRRTYAVRLPAGVDPCGLRQVEGDAALVAALDDAAPLTRLVFDDIAAQHQPETGPENRSTAAAALSEALSQIPDTVLRDGYRDYAAALVGVQADAIRSPEPPPPESPNGTEQRPVDQSPHLLRLEHRILRHLSREPRDAAQWLPQISDALLTSSTAKAVLGIMQHAVAQGVNLSTMTPTAWAGRLVDHSDDTMVATMQTLTAAPDDDPAVAHSLPAAVLRLRENGIAADLAAVRARLAAATGDEVDALLERIENLDSELVDVRKQIADADTLT